MPLLPIGRVRSLTTVVTTGLAAAVAASGLTVALAVPAHAERADDAPVTADDRVTVSGSYTGSDYGGGGQPTLVDVLANDHDPNGDELAICRVEVPDGAPLFVEQAGSSPWRGAPGPTSSASHAGSRSGSRSATSTPTALFVVATGNRAASYAIRYWACDHDYLTPATLTVTVRPVQPVRATVPRGRHRVRFTYPLRRAVRVEWGGLRGQDPDGSVRIEPGRSKVVDVKRRNLVWTAMTPSRSTPVGIGVLHGLRP